MSVQFTPMALLHFVAGTPIIDNTEDISGNCWLCGQQANIGVKKELIIRDTFMDIDKARLPHASHLCVPCAWCFSEQDETLTRRVGSFWETATAAINANPGRVGIWQKKNKTSDLPSCKDIGISSAWNGFAIPQRMRTYSHFVVNETWLPLTKAQKPKMREILFNPPKEHWLAIISDSGQKHLIFRGKICYGARSAVVQFEEQRIAYDIAALHGLYNILQALYDLGFYKDEIATGSYSRIRLAKIDLDAWRALEQKVKLQRGSALFNLALFLVQKQEEVE